MYPILLFDKSSVFIIEELKVKLRTLKFLIEFNLTVKRFGTFSKLMKEINFPTDEL